MIIATEARDIAIRGVIADAMNVVLLTCEVC